VKLLFDENLSARLVELLASEFPGSVHVEHVLGRGRSDAEVWEFARANGYAISVADGQIAAIAVSRNLKIASRDEAPFRAAGLAVINPWQSE